MTTTLSDNLKEPDMNTETHTELPTAVYSFLPSFSGDGYSYGGGAVVTFGDFSVPFGEGPRCHELAKKVTGAVNSHEALVAALRGLIKTATLLHANSLRCAVKHHGFKPNEEELPGWLKDAEADIDRARAALSSIGGGKSDEPGYTQYTGYRP